jgi:hypothetical protein
MNPKKHEIWSCSILFLHHKVLLGFTYLPNNYLLPTYLLYRTIWTTSYLLTYPFTYQPSCNLPINYLTFLLTYITNDMKYISEMKNLTSFVNFRKCSPLVRTGIIIGEVKGWSISDACNLYTCLKGYEGWVG